jgi:RNA-directed DNA polymerase
MERKWTAIKWIVDMDIQSYFDTINHDLLIALLERKIEDKRFLHLIQAMLDAGYLENWTYHTTYSGVPQGSIVSPLLANVYLHELDCFMKNLSEQFTQGKTRKLNPTYTRGTSEIQTLRKKWDTLKREEATKEQLQEVQRQIKQVQHRRRSIPSSDPFDSGYKRLYYCRYADDFIIGIVGSQADAEKVRQQVRQFIQETLKLTIAEEKSHIRHAKKGVTFVGYWVHTYSGNRIVKVKRGSWYTTFKSVSERIQFHIPKGVLQTFCAAHQYGNYATYKPLHKARLMVLDDAEIILAYNGELRGLANYYARAHSAKREMNKLEGMWRASLFKTLAAKHQESVSQIARRLRTEDGYALTIRGTKKTRLIKIFRLKDLKPPFPTDQAIDSLPNTMTLTLSRSELIRRLNTHQCEYCETTNGSFEVHHIRRMKDVAQGKQRWQQIMTARRRKTLVLCAKCHDLLHAGKLPDKEHLRAHK